MPIDYNALKTEINTDPNTRGYDGMSDAEIAADLNTAYRTKARDTIFSYEIYESVDRSEWTVLSAGNKDLIKDLFSLGEVNAKNGSQAASVILSVFGGGSTTVSNLVAVRDTPISRGEELGLGRVTTGMVQYAKSL